jgi:hypothetical protein
MVKYSQNSADRWHFFTNMGHVWSYPNTYWKVFRLTQDVKRTDSYDNLGDLRFNPIIHGLGEIRLF